MKGGADSKEVVATIMELTKQGIDVTPEIIQQIQALVSAGCDLSGKGLQLMLKGSSGLKRIVDGVKGQSGGSHGCMMTTDEAIAKLREYYGQEGGKRRYKKKSKKRSSKRKSSKKKSSKRRSSKKRSTKRKTVRHRDGYSVKKAEKYWLYKGGAYEDDEDHMMGGAKRRSRRRSSKKSSKKRMSKKRSSKRRSRRRSSKRRSYRK